MRSSESSPVESHETAGSFRRYLSLLMDLQGRRVGLALACMLFSGLLNGIGLFTLLPILQFAGVNKDQQTGFVGWLNQLVSQSGIPISLSSLLLMFVAIFAAHSLAMRWMNLLNADLQQSFTKALEQHLYASIMRADWTFFLINRKSDLTFALTQNVQRVASGTVSFLRLVSTVVISLIHVSLCVLISPLISLIMLACGATFSYVTLRYNRHIKQTGIEVVGLNKQLYGNVTEYLSGMKEAKSACSEQRQIDSFAQTSDALRDTWLNFSRIRENTNLIYKLGSTVVLSLMVFAAIEVYHVPLIEITLLVVIASRLIPRLQTVQANWQQVNQMLPAFDSIMSLLQRSAAACEVKADLTEGGISINHQIQLKDVGFSYHDGTEVLQDIQLRIPVGSTVAIVGPSGAGKSTVADLLMGLLTPQHGEILIDDQRLSAERLRAWRSQVGYVPQDTFLLRDTLRVNLLWSNPDATDEELRNALRMASAEQFVSELPEGLETIVGDRGIRLSGGERQRIALARAVVRKPKLLILDEATSSLDGENQQRIQEAVLALHGEMTIVVIAHRLSSVRNADQIVVLDEGRILESGTYDALVNESNGRFRDMVQIDAA